MWCLFALTQAPEVQRKLRQELLSLDTDTPTMEQLSALPYLDMVVRETLRVHAPVPVVFREATEDDVIPVAEPFVDRYGKVQDGIRYAACARDEVVVAKHLAQGQQGHAHCHPDLVDQ